MRRYMVIGVLSVLSTLAGAQTLGTVHKRCVDGDNTQSEDHWQWHAWVSGYLDAYMQFGDAVKGLKKGSMVANLQWVNQYNFPNDVGPVHEAVCQYIALHPETWQNGGYNGITDVMMALYKNPEAE